MMRRATWILTAIVAFAVAGCDNSSVASGPNSAPASPPTASSQPAHLAAPVKPAESGDILSVLSVEHQVDLSSQREGVVVSLTKDEGAVVQAGDILGQLDDRDLQMQLIKANDDLKVAQNNVKYKEAELKAKSAALRRQQQLRAAGLSSEADLEAAEFEAKGAEYDLHGWEALTESSQAGIHRLEIEIDQTRMRAPFSGVVVRRYIREGQAVPKQEKCFRVSQLAPLQVQFQIPESAARRPQVGAPVDLMLVDDASHSFSARLVKVSPTVDPASDSYNVTAQLSGSGISNLRPGMAVRVVWPGTSHGKP